MNATQATIEALAFTYGDPAVAVPVVIIEQVAARETLDALPCIEVCQAVEPETIEQLSRSMVNVRYRIEVAVILPGNADLKANGPIYRQWREQMRQAFQRVSYSTVPSMWYVNVVPGEVIIREAQRDNYDISLLEIEYDSAEQAS